MSNELNCMDMNVKPHASKSRYYILLIGAIAKCYMAHKPELADQLS